MEMVAAEGTFHHQSERAQNNYIMIFYQYAKLTYCCEDCGFYFVVVTESHMRIRVKLCEMPHQHIADV